MQKLTLYRFSLMAAVHVFAVWLMGLAVPAQAAEPAGNAPPVAELPGLGMVTNGSPTSDFPAPSPESSGASGSVAPVGGDLIPKVPSSNSPAPQAVVAETQAVRRPAANTPAANKGVAKPLASKRDLSAFKLITERNIFDPNRRARPVRGAVEERPKPVQVESFALVGVLSYAKGDFAFFDGTSSEYRKILKPADSIAGFKVQEIARNQVKLEAGGKALALPVGTQMRRQDAGEWQMSARAESYASNSAGGSNAASGSSRTGGSVGESDLLKRLMQQRERELKK